MIEIKIKNNSLNDLPKYATHGSSGVDLRADFSKGVTEKFLFGAGFDEERNVLIIFSGGRALIPTNLYTAIPEGYEIQIRSRSGLSLKNGVHVDNGIGTIDSDYRNSWGVILTNLGDEPFEIEQGDRIAQAVLIKVEKFNWNVVEFLDETERNLGGYGSSGTK
jgi:dUTP pyrophosphatase